MARPWPDCTPCGAQRIVALTPALAGGGVEVEVICEGRLQEPPTAVRVVGSLATDPSKACVVEPMVAPFDLRQLAQPTPNRFSVDQSNGPSLAIGGWRGQVWLGSTISTMTPTHLERAPLSFATIDLDETTTQILNDASQIIDLNANDRYTLAITDRYVAAPFSDNGYATLRINELTNAALGDDARVTSGIEEGSGFFILSTGDIAKFELKVGPKLSVPLRVGFGPRMITGRGEPAPEPYLGEAYIDDETGEPISMLTTADDSLYFWLVESTLAEAPDVLSPLNAVLTPEPAFPIRSMALDRSAIGSDGRNFMRGYLVTSRNLYQFRLSGTPPRWSTTPILLAAGEPVEVWMDNPRTSVGRVGYRNGEVFTLPGGFQLVNALQADATDASTGTSALRVTDYENLGGWPVALTENGLFVAQWRQRADGSLDNTFEDGRPGKAMDWERVTMPDGAQPWMKQRALLKVLRLPPRDVDGFIEDVFILQVFADDGVYEAGRVRRRTSK